MTIDEALSHLDTYSSTMGSGQTTQEQHEDAKRVAIDTMRKYQMFQADYEYRLKADMAAMLTEIQLEIEDLYPEHQCTGELTGFADAIETITPIIQQKIDKLTAGRGKR